MPKSTGNKRRHAGSETGLLASRRHPEVDVVAQPVVGIHVPSSKIRSGILSRLNSPGIDVLQAVPRNFSSGGIDAVVAQAGQNTSTLGQRPHAVELEARHLTGHVDEEDAVEERSLSEGRVGNVGVAKLARQTNKQADPDEPGDGLLGGRGAAARNLALLAHGRLLGGIDLGGDVEHGGVDPAAILGIVKGRAGEQRGEEEDVGNVVDERRELLEGAVLLQLGQLVGGELPIGHVPAKGRELHDEHHLGAGDVDDVGRVCDLALDVADGHVAHDEEEADPGHVGAAAQELCDGVGAARADEQSEDAIPEVEEADEVEE